MIELKTYHDYDNKIYSIDMLFAYINIFKPPSIKINIQDYLHFLEYKVWWIDSKKKISISPKDVIDNPIKYKNEYERIKNANINYPIIIANNNIIDGYHRLAKAYMQNKKQIKAYIIDKVLLKKFVISKNNSKLNINDLIELFYQRFN